MHILEKFRAKKRASLSRDISRHEDLTNFSSAPSERADDFAPAAYQICQKIYVVLGRHFLNREIHFQNVIFLTENGPT